jgi:DNA polymerase III delta subunit
MTDRVPLAYFFGDDDLSIRRSVDRFAAVLGDEGAPLERWDLRGNRNVATSQLGELQTRLATPVLFGGGTLAVLTNPGALTVKTDDRTVLIGLLALVAPGNGLVIVEETASGAKGPGQAKLAEAVQAAGGTLRAFPSPKEGALVAWVESEARDRGLSLGAGAAKELARRIGGFVREGDAERRDQTRRAALELEKLALLRPEGTISADDVAALVAEAIPGSAWALADAVAERDGPRGVELLETIGDTLPELVIVAVLHRRVRELIEVLDRLPTARNAADIGRPMGIASVWRVERLVEQARRWDATSLVAALDGLLSVEATVKGAHGHGAGEAQRRLAFGLWVADHVGSSGARRPRGAPPEAPSPARAAGRGASPARV